MSRHSKKLRALSREVERLRLEKTALEIALGWTRERKILRDDLNDVSDRYLELKAKHAMCKKKKPEDTEKPMTASD